MYENELTGANGAPNKAVGVVLPSVYTTMQNLNQNFGVMSKVVQDSLPSHRNSHR